MHKITLQLLLLLLSLPSFILSKETKSSVLNNDSLYFFTTNTLFVPTETSIIESKVGVVKYTDDKNLKLDIGVSFDLIGLKTEKVKYSFGVDFFTFSNLRSEDNFKFPVDAIDYLFGINFNFKKPLSKKLNLSGRFRISHISSHFEDGHKYENTDTIFTPVVFSKEFLDFAGVADYKLAKDFYFKGLLALNFIFHSIPEDAKGISGQLGLEFKYYLTKIFSLYISDNLSLASVNSDSNLNNNFETGVAFGMLNTRSILLYFTVYDGQDYRGQYYGDYLGNTGLGLRVKF